jgi:hypothetical protein
VTARRTWTAAEVLALGVRTNVETAGEILGGLSRTQAYLAVERGKFPVPVLKVGRRLVVPTAPLCRLLGIDPLSNGEGGPAPPGPPADITNAALSARRNDIPDDIPSARH